MIASKYVSKDAAALSDGEKGVGIGKEDLSLTFLTVNPEHKPGKVEQGGIGMVQGWDRVRDEDSLKIRDI